MKQTYTIHVTIMQEGVGGWQEQQDVTIEATSLRRAEAQAKRHALAGRQAPFYAYAHLHRDTQAEELQVSLDRLTAGVATLVEESRNDTVQFAATMQAHVARWQA